MTNTGRLMNNLKLFSPVLLRIGMAVIFIWFGMNQISDPNSWIGFVPQSIVDMSHLDVVIIVYLNGAFEIIAGSALILGFFTRTTALLLALHMIDITFVVGLDAIGMRDLGLSIATAVVWMNGMDWLTLDRFVRGQKSTSMPASTVPINPLKQNFSYQQEPKTETPQIRLR